MGLLSRAAGVAAAALLAACFTPAYEDGQFACGPQRACPPDMECASDNRCYHDVPDMIDADVDVADARFDAFLPADGALPTDGPLPIDATPADAGPDAACDAAIDAAVDAAPPDAAVDAAPPIDAPEPDAAVDAAPPIDAPEPDAAVDAASPPDAHAPDAAVDAGVDAAPADAAVDAALPPDASPPSLASEGLYIDIATKTLAPDVIEYEPAYALWSDGADKRRWIKLPPGTQIDTSDMDHWHFPTGTKLFKQFVRDGVLVETRVITRLGQDHDQVDLRTYQWNLAATDAFYNPFGAENANGTPHDIPDQSKCFFCHDGQEHQILGFQALQLSKDGPGVTLQSLAAAGLLTDPPPVGTDFRVPGTPVESDALGYLHANCGNCHNPTGFPTVTFNIDMDLFVTVDSTFGPADQTPPWLTTVNQPLDFFFDPPFTTRIVPGDIDASALYFRDSSRGNSAQMPPIATEIPDPDGLAILSDWILSLVP